MIDFLTQQNPRKATVKGVRAKLVFREPVTPDMLLRACEITGIKIDDFLARPQACLDGVTLSVSTAAAFMEVVLKSPPKINRMPIDVALAIANYALVDFFLSAFMGHAQGQTSALLLSGLEPGSPQAAGIQPS